jgi:hypothetical protein
VAASHAVRHRIEGTTLGTRIARLEARDHALGTMVLAIAFAVAACSVAQSPSPSDTQTSSNAPSVSVAPSPTLASSGPTAVPTLDSTQIGVIQMRALAVDGDVVYGDRHVAGTAKYEFIAYNLKTGATKDLGIAADAAAVSSGRLIWTTFTVEDGGGGGGAIPGCGWSIVHWRMYKLLTPDAKPTLLAKGDDNRQGWGECADSVPPLIAFDGISVAYADGATITILDVASGRQKRSIATPGAVDGLAMSNGSIAYLQEVDSRSFNDDELMLAGTSLAVKVQQKHAAWFAMAGGRIAWISPDTMSGAASTVDPVGSAAIALPDSFAPVDSNTVPDSVWDSLVAVSAKAVAWSWPSDRSSLAYWSEGQVRSCLIPTPGAQRGLVYPISVGSDWLVWMDGIMTRPGEWQDNDDPNTYAVPITALRCS